MGQRGPKPKNPALKMLAGNPGKRPIAGTSAPRFAPGAPKCPGWLNAEARKVFRRVVGELADADVCATVDADLIASYAAAVADLAAVSTAIDRGGVVIAVPTFNRNGKPTGHSAERPNPLLRTKDALMGRVRQLADALGIGPAARLRAGASADTQVPVGNKVLALRDRIQALRESGG